MNTADPDKHAAIMQLATVSNNITNYSWPYGKQTGCYQPADGSQLPFRSASWANNHDWMCTVSSTGLVEIISMQNRRTRQLCQIENVLDANAAAFFNSTKRNIAIACQDSILVYDLKTLSVRREYGPTMNSSEFIRVQVDPKDAYICGSTRDNRIYIYDQSSTNSNVFHVCNVGTLTNFALSNRSHLKVAACTDTGTCVLWEMEGSTSILNEPTRSAIVDIAFDCCNSTFLYVTDNRRCVVRDSNNSTTIASFNLKYTPICMDFCCDGVGFAIAESDGRVHAYDARYLGDPFLTIEKPCSLCKVSQIAFDKCFQGSSLQQYDSLWKICNLEDGPKRVEESANESTGTEAETMVVELMSIGRMQSSSASSTIRVSNNQSTAEEDLTSTLSSEIQNMIRLELQSHMKTVKTEIMAAVRNTVADTVKKQLLDIKTAIVQEFVKIEDILSTTSIHGFHPSKSTLASI